MTECIIVDVDGTIADPSARLHHIKGGKRDWKKFWIGMEKDKPLHHIIKIVRDMFAARTVSHKRDTMVFIVTARDEGVRPQTEAWLEAHGVPYDKLYMRGANDFRKDAVVKKEILEDIRSNGYTPIFALEDRDHNVEMFRANGVPCLQVAADEDEGEDTRDWEGQQVLTLLVGPAGAGKSTYRDNVFDPADVVSSDEVREAITVWDRNDPESWARLTDRDHLRTWKAVHDVVRARVQNGLTTVVDATNLRRRDRVAIVELAPKTQTVEYVILDRPLEDKLATRGWRSEELVTRMHDQFQASIKHALRGDDLPNVVVQDMRRVL